MEKRLHSSLRSSPESFLSAAVTLPFKSSKSKSKSTLKSLIHSIPPSSPLSSSFPPALRDAISHSISSFHNLPAQSPPSKRPRRSTRKDKGNDDTTTSGQDSNLKTLHALSYITFLLLSHPKKTFLPSDLFPSVQFLHDNLILFESDANLLSEISNVCEYYWKEDMPGREMLISQFLPVLLSRSLTLKKKVDVHKVYVMRDAFALFDFEDESIEDLKLLLIRCVVAPLYLKTEDGRKFLGFIFGLSMQLMKEALAMIKSQIAFGRKSILEGFGEVLFRAWKGLGGELKEEFENGFLQGLIEGATYASSRTFSASIRRTLGGFVSQRISDGVEKLLFRLAEPVIFRSLQVANSTVRLNALHMLLDLFPLQDPDSTKEVKDTLLDKQLFLLERLLMDDCPDVRVVAVEGCCRVLHLFWEIIPSPTITKLLTRIFDDMSHDICNEARLATLNGIIYLLGNPQSHEVLKVLLPRLGPLISDNSLSIRVAVMDLLLRITDIRTFQFNKVVGLDALLSTLSTDQTPVAQKITRLLIPSYFPSKINIEEACNRCITLVKRSPLAGARFCEFAALEGAPLKSLMKLARVLISLILSNENVNEDQMEGFLVAIANLSKNLVIDPCYRNALKEFLDGVKVKSLFAAASSGRAKSSILNILSAVSPEDVAVIFGECMQLVSNCSGLPENVEMQAEVQSAHKLLLSCDAFDDMLDVITKLLQKTAYRCHIKFGIEMPKQKISPGKRKKCRSSAKISAKWKYGSGKNASSFEEDYSVAVGIAWQIKDLLVSEDTRKALLQSQVVGSSFLALKVISEASIGHCGSYEYMDTTPVLAYTALALHTTLQNICITGIHNVDTRNSDQADSSTSNLEQSMVDQITDHLLNCIDKLLDPVDIGLSNDLSSGCTQTKKKASCSGEKYREPHTDASTTNEGSHYTKGKRMANKVKMLTAVLKFIVDCTAMGFLPHIHGRCLSFTSAYTKHVILYLEQQWSEKLQYEEDELKELTLCLKSTLSYAAKLLSLILRDTGEASPYQPAFDLANVMLDLMTATELYLGSGFTARLVSVAKSWLPDLVLALASEFLLKESQVESPSVTTLQRMKLHCPSWLSILAKNELCEMNRVNTEGEDDEASQPLEFPMFKEITDMVASLLKGSCNISDAVGVILLAGSIIGLENKDFGSVLGLIHFICVKLVGKDNREWSEFDMMLTFLPDIYPQIEKEIEEQTNEEGRRQLDRARELLEPVWSYHIYETGRFTVVEE